MALSIGIVGLPNVGKSTLFNALLGKAQAAASNFPFCTIAPNVGVVPVPDERLDVLTKMEGSAKTVPTAIQFVDIAGLVKGANEGQGLGNKFLAHIREVDAIIEVVRLFPDPNVIHVSGAISPKDDIETIHTELMLADLQTMEKHVLKVEKEAKTNPKLKPVVAFCEQVKQRLEQGQSARNSAVTDEERVWLKELQLISAKPILYVANVESAQLNDAAVLASLQAIATAEGASWVAIDAKTEAEVAELPLAEQSDYLKELGLDEPGLNKVIRAGYQLLNLITFLTTGPDETRAWTIKTGTKAPQAAGVIHTDFERGFIRAEIVSYTELVTAGSMKKAAEKGLVRQEGKDYVMQDGDVTYFKFNV
ncbi:redox-regulated ATPase YchF [Patescibacteria group bacterium]|nr:redox-regulated ATPase YchF [Patescibacteria group bacterium]